MSFSEDKKLYIFTDGSSLGNPGSGGYGAVIAFPMLDEVVELGGAKPDTTNNKMELSAVIAALSYSIMNTVETHIYTDSKYVIQGVTGWVFGWEKNGWLTAAKQPVSNKQLWQDLISLVRQKEASAKIHWHYVPGHVGVPGNERVDTIAQEYASGKNVQLYRGKLTEYPITDIGEIPTEDELEKMKAARKSKKSGKAFSYVSMVNGEILVHKTWDECKARVTGKNARFKKALSAEDQQDVIGEFQKLR